MANRLLHLRRSLPRRPHPYPYPLRNFSSSPDSSDIPQSDAGPGPDSGQSRPSSFSAYFNEVKSSLQKESSPQNRQPPPRKPFSFSNRAPSQSPPSKVASLEEIRRNLSEFRVRTAPAPPTPPSAGRSVSLQELYNKNIASPAASPDSKPSSGAGSPPSFDAIRETLRRLKETAPAARGQTDPAGKPADQMFSHFKLKPDANAGQGPSSVANFPSLYGKERVSGWGPAYGYQDLGEKLKSLRPDKRKGKWFTLQELSDRLAKLREIENKTSEEGIGVAVKDIRESLKKMIKSKEEKPKIGQSILDNIGTPTFMLSPPKEHLVGKFFHPDNMSAADKLKLELKKVRDEFKMSESDCGSARVQVAQLTTKIKYLSQVLPKKDKHSRKGLNGMVQRRKKLLKYLRRTDWDSYCLVLSKLGLRDNPDLKLR